VFSLIPDSNLIVWDVPAGRFTRAI